MEAFKKTVRLGAQTGIGSTFVFIDWDGKRLSMTGVEGPTLRGDAKGGCGQISMHEWEFANYAHGWTADKVQRLRQIWDEWHLNDMRAYDAAMKRDGWREKAATPMLGYEFRRTTQADNDARAVKEQALAALKAGETFTPTPWQVEVSNRPYSYTEWVAEGEAEPAPKEHYERARHIGGHWNGDIKSPEHKTLGWLYPKDHPEGLLARKHPESGNGYGSAWYSEDVPDDVLQWLADLPATDVELKGAWGRDR